MIAATLEIVAINLALLLAALTLLWLVSLRLRDASIIDIFWGLGFVVVAWSTRAQLAAPSPESILLPLAATLWGVRLAAYLAARNLGHGEDKRYAAMRRARPTTFWWWSYLAVFGLQGVLCLLVSLPLQLGQIFGQIGARPSGVTLFDVVGLLLFVFGFAYESIADYQLARFKRDPANAGKVMDSGLWRHTRHPNYFGEAVLWWGIGVMAAAAPEARWAFVGPLLITLLLLRVSGVTLLEKTIVDRRPGYADYIRRTNAFIPGPRGG